MKREERKEYIKQHCAPHILGKLDVLVDEIYSDFEKLVDKLEAPKNCNTCKYYIKSHQSSNPWMGGKVTTYGASCGAGIINGYFVEDMYMQNCYRYKQKDEYIEKNL
jgi:hypothetical protein